MLLGSLVVLRGSALAEATAPPVQRIALRVLVLTAGDAGTAWIERGLVEAGVPFTRVDLKDAARPRVDAAFLRDAPVAAPAPFTAPALAKFQAIVTPDDALAELSADERAALAAFQREFAVRRASSFVSPTAAVHMHAPGEPGLPSYAGNLDGLTAEVTAHGRDEGFGYLAGALAFDEVDPAVVESYGYLATALPPRAGRALSPLLEMAIPGGSERGVLVGVFEDEGREELIVCGALNADQLQAQALFRGVLQWLTRGVSLGSERHYLSIHVDDVFLANARWIPEWHCTTGADCPPDVAAPDIAMTAEDVDYLLQWQARSGFELELAFNGGGYAAAVEDYGAFPLGERLLAGAPELRWINHTYSHEYLGCVQDPAIRPLRCAQSAMGTTAWASYELVEAQIGANVQFAQAHGLGIDPGELVTGEHSGLRRLPDEPQDNPNLLEALAAHDIEWIASDSSRELESRAARTAATLPRHPLSLYFNVATRREETSEYVWLYASAADGGSGACESTPAARCIPPLDPETGYEDYIVPREARTLVLHALSNAPLPHYAHQSNLAEDRLLYPLLDRVLAEYRGMFSPDTPLVSLRMRQAGIELQRVAAWRDVQARISATFEGGTLRLVSSESVAVAVPLTLPAGSSLPAGQSLASYAGQLTGWVEIAPGAELALRVGMRTSLGEAE